MPDPFWSSRRKIDRANKHLAELDGEISSFLSLSKNRCECFTEPDPNKPENNVCKMRLTVQLPETLSEITGGVVNNLREALDHATYSVAVAGGRSKPKVAYFPFSGSADDLENSLKGRCTDVPKEIWPLLRSYQPYKGGSDLLYALNQACIANKHKLLVPIGTATLAAGVTIRGTGGYMSTPYPRPVWDSAKQEMELFTIGPGAQIHSEFQFGTYVTFGEVDILKGEPAIETLNLFADMVRTIVDEIDAESRWLGIVKT